MTFADNLVRLRREKGFSQEQLADLMDVSRQAVSKWEADAAVPDTDKLIALSKLFGLTLNELLQVRAGGADPAAEHVLDAVPQDRGDAEQGVAGFGGCFQVWLFWPCSWA